MKIKIIILILCVIVCAIPIDLAAQNKKNVSSFLDNLYNSSQNQRRNQRSNSSTSELEKMLQDAKKRSDKKKEEKKARQQSAESNDPDAFFFDSYEKRKDNENKKSEKKDKTQSDVNAKREKDDISLVVNGEGSNKTEATRNALRSAIEQAYGTFVSASTEILNDELVKDEIATISSGNIKSYKELSSTVLPNGSSSVTLSAVVSIGKLIKYAQAHGSSAEFAGQTFMMNMRMRELNKKNEALAMKHLYSKLSVLQPYLYDCALEVGEPKQTKLCQFDFGSGWRLSDHVLDSGYSIPLCIVITPTDNLINWLKELEYTLSVLSLSEEEIKSFKENEVRVYSFRFFDNEYYLRNCYYPFSNLEHETSLYDCVDILNSWYMSWVIEVNGGQTVFYPVLKKQENQIYACSLLPMTVFEVFIKTNDYVYRSKVATSATKIPIIGIGRYDNIIPSKLWEREPPTALTINERYLEDKTDKGKQQFTPYSNWSFYFTFELFFNDNNLERITEFNVRWNY